MAYTEENSNERVRNTDETRAIDDQRIPFVVRDRSYPAERDETMDMATTEQRDRAAKRRPTVQKETFPFSAEYDDGWLPCL